MTSSLIYPHTYYFPKDSELMTHTHTHTHTIYTHAASLTHQKVSYRSRSTYAGSAVTWAWDHSRTILSVWTRPFTRPPRPSRRCSWTGRRASLGSRACSRHHCIGFVITDRENKSQEVHQQPDLVELRFKRW